MTSPLLTVRDFLRYAVSRFNTAELVYGHGATNAFDEAAFLVLEGLRLPIDRLEPFLDAKLLPEECDRLSGLIEARVRERKPAAYLLGRAYMQGVPFEIDPRAIVPRSFIGELLAGPLFAGGPQSLIEDPRAPMRVLDLCTGSGCLAILAAQAFDNAEIDALDVSADALELARRNVVASGLDKRIRLLQGDLFRPVRGERYSLVIANPPYVDADAMAALPPEYRHEPSLALDGGRDGLDIVRRILSEASSHLEEDGALLCEIGAGRSRLESEFSGLAFLWLDTDESEGETFWLPARDLP